MSVKILYGNVLSALEINIDWNNMNRREKYFGKKRVLLYPSEEGSAPIIYSNDFEESGIQLLRKAEEMDVRKFHLVTISKLDWDEELSPWPHEKVVSDEDHFTGQADEYMSLLESEILPWAENTLSFENGKRILAGYSMAGLFSAYAPFISDRFDAFVCASASVWYPGFEEYFLKTEFKKEPEAVYFSLGDRETKVSNPYLQTTEDVMKNLRESLKNRGIPSTFELNPGNHFKKNVLRVIKGIDWVMKTIN